MSRRPRAPRRAGSLRGLLIGGAIAAILVGALIAILLSSGKTAGEAELGQQRADLALVAGQLAQIEAPLKQEVSKARALWPTLYKGMPHSVDRKLLAQIAEASDLASSLRKPQFLELVHELSGPGSRIANLFHTFLLLSVRGWSHLQEDAEAIRSGPPASARFARRTADLYIESIYSSLFSLVSIGEKTLLSYERLGGGEVFGSALTPSEVKAIAKTFSPQADELEPHEWRLLQLH